LAPQVPNYDRSDVPDYQLPDPLLLDDGTPVTSAETWWRRRRPEILTTKVRRARTGLHQRHTTGDGAQVPLLHDHGQVDVVEGRRIARDALVVHRVRVAVW